jgi:hypothetical protein
MPRRQHPERNLRAAEHVFNTATAAVGGLYLATHSIIATIAGTAAATALGGWHLWLSHRREHTQADRKEAMNIEPAPD